MNRNDVEAWVKVFEGALEDRLGSSNRRKRLRPMALPYSERHISHIDLTEEIALVGRHHIPGAISYGINQTRQTARREHIKADRQERVSLFVTDLRRAILCISMSKPAKDFFVSLLCRKELWHDAGVLSDSVKGVLKYYPGSSSLLGQMPSVDRNTLEGWCQQAWGQVKQSPEIDIKMGLDELASQMSVMSTLIRTATQINDEAAPIVDGLLKLGEEVS